MFVKSYFLIEKFQTGTVFCSKNKSIYHIFTLKSVRVLVKIRYLLFLTYNDSFVFTG